MKQPWQIWLLFALCLAIVVPAMGWMTVKAIESDRAERTARRAAELARRDAELARQRAEIQELVGKALWRMDWMLTPLIAQEAARPYFVYQSFYAMPATKTSDATPNVSPILVQPSEYVQLHFQVGPDNVWTSPQRPALAVCELAFNCGTTPVNVELSEKLLDQLRRDLKHDQLLTMVPEQLLSAIDQPGQLPWETHSVLTMPTAGNYPANDVPSNQYDLPQQGQVDANPQTREPIPAQLAQAGQSLQEQERVQQLRRGNEWQMRNRGIQNYAQNLVVQQRANPLVTAPALVQEGVSRPIWVDSKLLLARRVIEGNRVTVQGCWFDWDKISQVLVAEVGDLLPEVQLQPITDITLDQPGQSLATVPVQLVVPTPVLSALPVSEAPGLSAMRISLVVAWSCLFLATIAVAVLLQGVVKLSERRGAFVSAVTHELRTPLTTFRMYAEMLAEDMVQDAGQRRDYTHTLRVEADRLTHLVENVLQYARLERNRSSRPRVNVQISELYDRCRPRMSERAGQSLMTLNEDVPAEVGKSWVSTDPAAVEQILFNLVDNACKYASGTEDSRIQLRFSVADGRAVIRVRDHGPGIDPAASRRLFKPFSKSVDEAAVSAPGVGLGLALSRRLARDLSGTLRWESPDDGGACFTLTLPLAESS